MASSVYQARAQHVAVLGFFLFMAVVPVLEVFASRSIGLGVAVAGLLAVPFALTHSRALGAFLRPALVPYLAALLLIVLQLFHTDAPTKAVQAMEIAFLGLSASGACLYFAARFLSPEMARKILTTLLISCAVAAVLFTIEWIFELPLNRLLRELKQAPPPFPYDLDRGLNILSLLVWPLLLVGRAYNVPRLVLWGIPPVAAVLIYQTMSQSAAVGLMVGSVVFVLAHVMPRLTSRFMQAGILLGFMGAPWIAQLLYDVFGASPDLWTAASAGPRIGIWAKTAEVILAAPFLGHGIEGVRAMIGFGGLHNHPHCGPLELWIEFGFIGPLFVALLLCWMIEKIKAYDSAFSRPMLAALAAWLLIFSVGYGIWQAWWMATMVAIPLVFIIVLRAYAPANAVSAKNTPAVA